MASTIPSLYVMVSILVCNLKGKKEEKKAQVRRVYSRKSSMHSYDVRQGHESPMHLSFSSNLETIGTKPTSHDLRYSIGMRLDILHCKTGWNKSDKGAIVHARLTSLFKSFLCAKERMCHWCFYEKVHVENVLGSGRPCSSNPARFATAIQVGLLQAMHITILTGLYACILYIYEGVKYEHNALYNPEY